MGFIFNGCSHNFVLNNRFCFFQELGHNVAFTLGCADKCPCAVFRQDSYFFAVIGFEALFPAGGCGIADRNRILGAQLDPGLPGCITCICRFFLRGLFDLCGLLNLFGLFSRFGFCDFSRYNFIRILLRFFDRGRSSRDDFSGRFFSDYFGSFFRHSSLEGYRIQLDSLVVNAVVMLRILVSCSLVCVQIGQAVVLDKEDFRLSIDVGRDTNDVITCQFAFSGHTFNRIDDRICGYRSGFFLLPLVCIDSAGSQLGKACNKGILSRSFGLFGFFGCRLLSCRFLSRFFSGLLCRFFSGLFCRLLRLFRSFRFFICSRGRFRFRSCRGLVCRRSRRFFRLRGRRRRFCRLCCFHNRRSRYFSHGLHSGGLFNDFFFTVRKNAGRDEGEHHRQCKHEAQIAFLHMPPRTVCLDLPSAHHRLRLIQSLNTFLTHSQEARGL